MSSRMIHLAIAQKISKEFNLNKAKFNFGNLLPDLYQEDRGKDISHYRIIKESYEESKSDVYKYYDYESFLLNYKEQMDNEIYLGYYCHLITDELWIQKIYIKYMRDENRKKRYDLQKSYYEDYFKINQKIKGKYNLRNEIEIDTYEIEYIDKEKVNTLLKHLEEDFETKDEKSALVLLDLEEVFSFIDETSHIISNIIKELTIK